MYGGRERRGGVIAAAPLLLTLQGHPTHLACRLLQASRMMATRQSSGRAHSVSLGKPSASAAFVALRASGMVAQA